MRFRHGAVHEVRGGGLGHALSGGGKVARNVGESVYAKLRAVAKANGLDMPGLLTRYVLERLLYRLGASAHREKFLLKGGLCFAVWLGDLCRPTMDMDLHGVDVDRADAADVVAVLREVCAADAGDGVAFDFSRLAVDAIQEERVPGARFAFDATVHTAKVRVRVDVGFGHAVTPGPTAATFPSLIETMPRPEVVAYPRETSIAEKLAVMVEQGRANTRMKDYYDVWVLIGLAKPDAEVMSEAVARTFAQRGAALPEETPPGLRDDFADHASTLWKAFVARNRLRHPAPPFAELLSQVRDFAMPAFAAARETPSLVPSP